MFLGGGIVGVGPEQLDKAEKRGELEAGGRSGPFVLRLAGGIAHALASALGCCAVMYGVLGVKLMVVDMPANECSGSDCPRGMLAVWLLAVVFGVGRAAVAGIASRMTEGFLSSRGIVAVGVLGVLAGVWPGWLGYVWLRGPQMDAVWKVARDRPSSVEVLGYWTPDASSVVRVRSDVLRAYGTARGDVRWSVPAPARSSVCALSRTAPSGIGVVGFERRGKPCGATVAAVDLRTGRTLWSRDVTPGDRDTAGGDGLVLASAGTTAVVRDRGAVVGLGLGDGSPRWRLGLAQNCGVRGFDGSGDGVLLVEECAGAAAGRDVTLRLSLVDAGSGGRIWQRTLPTTGPVRAVQVLSADPVAVYVAEQDERGFNGVVLYDDAGRRRAMIPLAGPEDDLTLTPYGAAGLGYGSAARGRMHVLHVAVGHGVFISVVNDGEQGVSRGVSAYSLADGRRVWHRDFDDGITALATGRDGEIDVVTSQTWDQLWRMEPRSGALKGESVVLHGAPLSTGFDVRPRAQGGYLFVNLEAGSGRPALLAVE